MVKTIYHFVSLLTLSLNSFFFFSFCSFIVIDLDEMSAMTEPRRDPGLAPEMLLLELTTEDTEKKRYSSP